MSLIWNEKQILDFYDRIYPWESDGDPFHTEFFCLAARKKYMTEEQKKSINLGDTCMMFKTIIKEHNPKKFYSKVLQADACSAFFLDKDDNFIPQDCMVYYININRTNVLKAIKEFKKNYPSLHYHITSGDTEQIAEKPDKGLLDFLVLAELPDARKYEYLAFPEKDVWGLIIPAADPLSKKERITISDLKGLPLFCSDQAWEGEIKEWAGNHFSDLILEGSFRLSYNGSIFAKEGLGYLLTFDHLIDTSEGSGVVFRPLSPKLETTLYLDWTRYQTFTPIAGRFLQHLKTLFADAN